MPSNLLNTPPLYAVALNRTPTLVSGHLLNTPLYADALARTHTLVPGYLLNMPSLLTSMHAHPSTPWYPRLTC